MAVAILFREEIKEYDFGSGHPFHGDRYGSFMNLLKSRLEPGQYYQVLAAEPADNQELLRICDEDYIDFCREYYHSAASGWIGYYENFSRYQSLDNKPIGTPGQLEQAARLIIGQAKTACDHHVAEWDGEIRAQRRAAHQATARAGHHHPKILPLQRQRLGVVDEGAMTHIGEYLRVLQAAVRQASQVGFQLRQIK